MRPQILLCLLVILAGCACGRLKKDNEVHDAFAAKMDRLRIKRDLYLSLQNSLQDKYGSLPPVGDALLFNCLNYAGGAVVDFQAFEKDHDGRWYRHPDWQPGPPDKRWSSISRDMVVGVFHCIWASGKRDPELAKSLITRFIKYGQDHRKDGVGWVLGEHGANERDEERVMLTPTGIATAYEISKAFGGPDNPVARSVPQAWDPHARGFPAHLEMQTQLLRGLIQGAVNDNELAFMRYQSDTNPKNALYSAIFHLYKDGDMNQAVDLLLDESMFPATSLPTSANFCSDYLFQRGQFNKTNNPDDKLKEEGKDPEATNPDWLPCSGENQTHVGIDFVFAAHIILDNLHK